MISATRVIGYCRVSLEKQADRGVSLEAQQAKIRAYAELYDLELVDVVVDAGVSAKTLERPGLHRALQALKSGAADALLVVKLDRLTRSVADLGALLEKHFAKAALLSVSENLDTRSAAGRLVLNVLASVSQWEREAIGERTSQAMRFKAENGEYTGGRPPFGYRIGDDGVTLEDDPAEQAVLRRVEALRQEGSSLRAIVEDLRAQGVRSRSGAPFAFEQVRRMVARCSHSGQRRAA